MQVRGLLLAALLMAVLAGGVWWSKKHGTSAENKAADETPKILSVPEDQITQVEIRKKDAKPVVLKKEGGKWQIAKPEFLPADEDSASSLVSTLSSLSSDRVVEEKGADLSIYGLQSPQLEVEVLRKDGKSDKILIGDEAPTGGAYYAKASGDERVFTLASWNKSSLDKTVRDLRDKRLLTFDSDKLSRVELRVKGQVYEFGKNSQNEWQIVKPRPLRANNGEVEDLVRRLRDAKMDTFISEEEAAKADSKFASGTLVGTAIVTDASGSQQIEVRKGKDNSYYARSSVVKGAHKLMGDLGDSLGKSLDDYRNKKLFDFGFSDPTKVEVKSGDKTQAFEKSGEKWMSGGKEMDGVGVQTLIGRLRDLSATRFPEQGFTKPEIELSVVSDGGKRTEKVLIAKNGNRWIAKRENEPSLYELDQNAVEDIQKGASEVKPASPPQGQNKK